MKKILFILILPFILGGCYDYNELNDLALIAGIGVDYEDNMYTVTFEILSTKKSGEQSGATSTYTVSAKGNTVTEAFMNNGNNMDKVPYYDHIEVVIISDKVAKEHLEDVSEYIIRSSKFRNEVYLVISKDKKAQEILNTTSKEKPIASSFMVDLLEHSNHSSSSGYYTPFTKFLNKVLTQGEDGIAPIFTIKDKEIVLDGLGVFKDFKLVYDFKNNDAATFNLINNFNPNTVLFTKSCGDDKDTVLSIYDSKIKIKALDNKIKITGILNGRINADACGYNFRKLDTYTTLEKDFSNIIAKDMDKIIDSLKSVQSNALSIGKIYYNKYRQKNYLLWTKEDFVYDLNLKINKKGLIFEVKNEN